MFRRFFAGFLLFIFVLIAAPLVLFFVSYRAFISEEFYSESFLPIIYEYSLDSLSRNFEFQEGPALDPSEIREVLSSVLTFEDFSEVVDSFLNQVKEVEVSIDGKVSFLIPFDWLISKAESISYGVSDLFIEKIDFCSRPEDFSSVDFNCIPAGITKVDFKNQLIEIFEKNIENIPSEYVFELRLPSQFGGKILYDYYSDFVFKVLVVVFSILIFLLCLIGVIIFRPWMRILKWEAKALFWAISAPFLSIVIMVFISRNLPIFSELAYFDFYYFFFIEILKRFVLYFGLVLLILLFLLIYMSILDNRQSKKSI